MAGKKGKMDKKMGEKRQIKLDNGWLVDVIEAKHEGEGYTIEKIHAYFGYGVYHPIDTSDLTEDEWLLYHEALRGEVKE